MSSSNYPRLPVCIVKEKQLDQLINENGKRNDGREKTDIRPLFIKVGIVSHARGSAYIEAADTKVLCSVYGPREISRKQEFSTSGILHCEITFAPFSCSQRIQDKENKELSLLLKQALEPVVCLHKFPKAQIDVYVTILENAGSALAISMTSAGIALTDAGIEMYDLIIGCSLKQSGQDMLLDPNKEEERFNGEDSENTCSGSVTLGFLPNKQQIAAFSQVGNIDHHELVKATKLLTEGCHRIYPVVKQALSAGLLKESKNKREFH